MMIETTCPGCGSDDCDYLDSGIGRCSAHDNVNPDHRRRQRALEKVEQHEAVESAANEKIKGLAKQISEAYLDKLRHKWETLLNRKFTDRVTCGFTIVCNRCGSINVRILEVHEYASSYTDMECVDCKKRRNHHVGSITE